MCDHMSDSRARQHAVKKEVSCSCGEIGHPAAVSIRYFVCNTDLSEIRIAGLYASPPCFGPLLGTKPSGEMPN